MARFRWSRWAPADSRAPGLVGSLPLSPSRPASIPFIHLSSFSLAKHLMITSGSQYSGNEEGKKLEMEGYETMSGVC